jgi:hypothetical protein
MSFKFSFPFILKDLVTKSVLNTEMSCLRAKIEERILQMIVGNVVLVAKQTLWDRGRGHFPAN